MVNTEDLSPVGTLIGEKRNKYRMRLEVFVVFSRSGWFCVVIHHGSSLLGGGVFCWVG